jgi:membrane peptidoglycan carboxypeptidase
MGVNNGTLLAANPATGEILAWVGSADYASNQIGGQFDVILSPRQPGSSFKPYVYEAALKDRKITLCSTLHDSATSFGGYRPLDFDNRFMGSMSARRALVLSRNVPAVETAEKEGIQNVTRLAAAMGIRTNLNPVLSTAIGGSEVTMFDHVQGYQVFANEGEKVNLGAITKVVDGSGNVIYLQPPGRDRTRVLSAAETYLVTDVLKDYQNQWRLGWNRQLASKSGTSGGTQVGVHPDAWMMAYNPRIVVGAWAGNTGPDGHGQPTSAFGVNVGSSILAGFVNSLPREYSAWYQRPAGIVQGKRSGEIFLSGTENSACTTDQQGTPEGQKNNKKKKDDEEGE